jgi:hypothetical protein
MSEKVIYEWEYNGFKLRATNEDGVAAVYRDGGIYMTGPLAIEIISLAEENKKLRAELARLRKEGVQG